MDPKPFFLNMQIEEFLATADEYNQEPVSKRSPMSGEMLCKHKEHFAHGLCEKCYNKFIKLSGGLEGADPPAFQRAEKQRFEAAKRAEEAAAVKEAAVEESLCDTQNSNVENTITPKEVIATVQRNAHTMGIRGDKSSTIASEELNDSVLSKDPEGGGENCEGDVETESLSDINDVDWYLHNEEETQCKNILGGNEQRVPSGCYYLLFGLQEQAAKEALAARGVVQEAKKKRRRNEDTKSSKPAETPAEVTYNMLKRKGLGSKVSEGALGELYKTLDEDGNINEKGEMDFEAQYGLNNADGETFNHVLAQ
ncbi:unnamed protein product [Miscanthus lutarioriparius]|uniref:Brf1 TBP-binding domain-containing protein n=1 Tax=Miscanthus lutarioriparius TaxID=422564 RepID=A0A811NGW3_9POAL|nr:unnamed protein product [Miscanthus lutarioriparius]